MKINQIIVETSTTAGSISTVSMPLGEVQKRNPIKTVSKKGPYANSLSEGAVKQLSMDLKGGKDGLNDEEFKKKYGKTKQEVRAEMKKQPEKQEPVKEDKLDEEDKIIAVGKGSKLKTGLHGKNEEPKFKNFVPPFKAEGLYVSDKRGKNVCECSEQMLAPLVAKALNAFVATNESIDIEGAGVVAGGAQYEGAKVDRMVKHIAKSEKKLGHSKKEAENIAWATANKRGMLDNKNKKAK
jgi:hypothetical protein